MCVEIPFINNYIFSFIIQIVIEILCHFHCLVVYHYRQI